MGCGCNGLGALNLKTGNLASMITGASAAPSGKLNATECSLIKRGCRGGDEEACVILQQDPNCVPLECPPGQFPSYDAFGASACKFPSADLKCPGQEFLQTGPNQIPTCCDAKTGFCHPQNVMPCKEGEFYGLAEQGPYKDHHVCCSSKGECYDPSGWKPESGLVAVDDKTKTYLMYGLGAAALLGIAYLMFKKGK